MSNTDACKRYRERWPERVKANRRKRQRVYTLRTKFGISLRAYDRRLKQQHGACAICKRTPEGEDRYRRGKNLAVDHNHSTGKIRGLLCDKCNRGLGHFNDDPDLLIEALLYLRR